MDFFLGGMAARAQGGCAGNHAQAADGSGHCSGAACHRL